MPTPLRFTGKETAAPGLRPCKPRRLRVTRVNRAGRREEHDLVLAAAEVGWQPGLDTSLAKLLRRAVAGALQKLAHWIESGGEAAANAFDLDRAIEAVEAAAMAPSTRKSYAGALRRFGGWLRERAPSDALLSDYLGVLSDAGKSSASAKLVVAAVRRSARELRERGGCAACPAGPETRRRLERYRRDTAERPPLQARGIVWEDADRMCEAAEADGELRGMRDAAVVGIGSDGMLRVSEVSALEVEDLTFAADGSARARIRRSKTDQVGIGAEVYVGPPGAGRILRWMDQADIKPGLCSVP